MKDICECGCDKSLTVSGKCPICVPKINEEMDEMVNKFFASKPFKSKKMVPADKYQALEAKHNKLVQELEELCNMWSGNTTVLRHIANEIKKILEDNK